MPPEPDPPPGGTPLSSAAMLGQLLRGALVTQLIHVAATLLRRSMLLVASGRERTAEEYRALLATAGFDVRRIIPTRSPASVVEAVPAPE